MNIQTKTLTFFAKKIGVNITIRNFPDLGNARLESMIRKYYVYHEIGSKAVREGMMDLDFAKAKVAGPRKPPVMKTGTLVDKLTKRLDADPSLELRLAAQRLMARKKISFNDAKLQIQELWGVDDYGQPVEEEVEEEDDENEEESAE